MVERKKRHRKVHIAYDCRNIHYGDKYRHYRVKHIVARIGGSEVRMSTSIDVKDYERIMEREKDGQARDDKTHVTACESVAKRGRRIRQRCSAVHHTITACGVHGLPRPTLGGQVPVGA